MNDKEMDKIPNKQELTGTEKPNRMDRRRMETRAKLLNATLALVVKKGIEKTTMDDITEKADLGRRTLYYHFNSKEECVIAAAAMYYTKVAAEADLSAHQHQDPALAFAVAGQTVMRRLVEAPITAKLIEYPRFLATAIKQSISGYVDHDLALAFEQGRFTAEMEGRLFDTTILWVLIGTLIDTIENKLDIDETLTYFMRMYLVVLGLPHVEAQELSAKAVALAK